MFREDFEIETRDSPFIWVFEGIGLYNGPNYVKNLEPLNAVTQHPMRIDLPVFLPKPDLAKLLS